MSKSPTSTDELLHNPHAGEILLLEFLQSMGLSSPDLGRAIGIPARRINEIVSGRRPLTAEIDLRLTRYFGLSEGFFLGLQIEHDLRESRRAIGHELEAITPRAA